MSHRISFSRMVHTLRYGHKIYHTHQKKVNNQKMNNNLHLEMMALREILNHEVVSLQKVVDSVTQLTSKTQKA